MSERQNYNYFSEFIYRTPACPFPDFLKNMARLEQDALFWQEFLQDTWLREAIYLASPVLYEEIRKFLSGAVDNSKEVAKLQMSVLRYYTRMATRSTPFGLFAGCSIGKIADTTNIALQTENECRRVTRLDMNYLCNLIQDIAKAETVQQRLRYYPNSSLYLLGQQLRYVEYSYKNKRRLHKISAVDFSGYLASILDKAAAGATIQALATSITDEEITLEEATEFIHELIENQILVSELEPTVTGADALWQLINALSRYDIEPETLTVLKDLEANLNRLDSVASTEKMPVYQQIEALVKSLKTTYDPKFLFQVDMFRPVREAMFDKKVTDSVLEALTLMNKLSPPLAETSLSKFAEAFYERYEDKEMPLLEVMDTETGIGYPQNSGDVAPLLKDIMLPMRQSSTANLTWDRIQAVLYKKFMEAFRDKAFSLELTDGDFSFVEAQWNDLPVTFSAMCQVFFDKDGASLIHCGRGGGSSAANLLGRFCHLNKDLERYVQSITHYEQEQNSDVVYAEIVHLPESRVGNILMRPVLREYEMPYLCRSGVEQEKRISLSDLYISVKAGRIVLRSKRLNKEVMPRLSTAHNYAANSMPVYHFLCDMQTQGLRGGIGFRWSPLFNDYDFLPRVMYKNVILSLAQWKIKTDEFKKMTKIEEPEEAGLRESALEDIHKWREEKQMPRFVVLPDGDNTLFVDMDNYLSIQVLYSVVKKRPQFSLEEFPFDPEHAIVKDVNGGVYTNEFIFSFYKTNEKPAN